MIVKSSEGKDVEVDKFDRNPDRSRFAVKAFYVDSGQEIDDAEYDYINDTHFGEFNPYWG